MRVLLMALFVGLGLIGQSEGLELPPAPRSLILDEAGLFDRHPERLVEISRRLMALEEKHDLPVYLAVYGGLLESDIEQQTRGLYLEWVGEEKDGVVVVWDSDTRSLEFGLPSAAYYDLGGEDALRTRLPDSRLRPVLNGVEASVKGIEDKAEFVERLSVVLTARLDDMLREEGRSGGVSGWRVAMATIFLGGILVGIALCAGRLVRSTEREPQKTCYFPDVLVGARLGAGFGGGRVAVVDYMKEDDGEDDE